jgi:hypothetical protein
MSYKYSSNNEVVFKIIIEFVINKIIILKITSLFDRQFINIYKVEEKISSTDCHCHFHECS